MNLVSGIDLIEIERIRDAITRHGDRLLHRVFTSGELKACRGRAESLAARFAVKEAAAKALGCGIGIVGWRDIEVLSEENNAPKLKLHGKALKIANKRRLSHWSISISHNRLHAIALVIAASSDIDHADSIQK